MYDHNLSQRNLVGNANDGSIFLSQLGTIDLHMRIMKVNKKYYLLLGLPRHHASGDVIYFQVHGYLIK